jgi:hypothetical protein
MLLASAHDAKVQKQVGGTRANVGAAIRTTQRGSRHRRLSGPLVLP